MTNSPAVAVVDASLALRRLIAGAFQPEARSLWRRWDGEATLRISPAIFSLEVASALLRQVRVAHLPPPEAHASIAGLLRSVTIVPDDATLAERAFDIAHSVGASKVYDSMYAALAEREGCELWTGDERYWNAAHGRYPWIRWVGEVRL